jgi:hypothetical protein
MDDDPRWDVKGDLNMLRRIQGASAAISNFSRSIAAVSYSGDSSPCGRSWVQEAEVGATVARSPRILSRAVDGTPGRTNQLGRYNARQNDVGIFCEFL